MKWNKSDLTKYVQAKEYIDTIIIPLMPFHLSEEGKLAKSANELEVFSLFANEMEKELTGRIMLTPNYHYLKGADKKAEANRINMWIKDIQTQPFNHIFLLTFDSTWKKYEQSLDGNLLWLPSIQTNDIYTEETDKLIRNQVSQVGELIRSYW